MQLSKVWPERFRIAIFLLLWDSWNFLQVGWVQLITAQELAKEMFLFLYEFELHLWCVSWLLEAWGWLDWTCVYISHNNIFARSVAVIVKCRYRNSTVLHRSNMFARFGSFNSWDQFIDSLCHQDHASMFLQNFLRCRWRFNEWSGKV